MNQTNTTEATPVRLTGAALLAHIAKSKELGLPKRKMVQTAGYTRSSNPRAVNMEAFYSEVIRAQGGPDFNDYSVTRSRRLSYAVSVSHNGNIGISSAYAKQMGWKPEGKNTTRLNVICSTTTNCMILTPLGPTGAQVIGEDGNLTIKSTLSPQAVEDMTTEVLEELEGIGAP